MADLITLPADLPVDWSPGQIVAPTGEEVGLTPQHGYIYLMEQVNAAHRTLNELTAAVVAYTNDAMPGVTTVKQALDAHEANNATLSKPGAVNFDSGNNILYYARGGNVPAGQTVEIYRLHVSLWSVAGVANIMYRSAGASVAALYSVAISTRAGITPATIKENFHVSPIPGVTFSFTCDNVVSASDYDLVISASNGIANDMLASVSTNMMMEHI